MPGNGENCRRFERFLEANKKSRYTVRQYAFFVRHMLDYLEKDSRDITPDDLERYKEHMALDLGYSKASIALAVHAIRAYFGFLGMDVCSGLQAPRRPRSSPRYLSEREVSRLIDAARTSPRDHAIICTLAYTGLRVGELCALTLDDLDFEEKIINIRSGKGERDRVVIMDERVEKAIRAYLTSRGGGSPRLFTTRKGPGIGEETVQRIVRKYAERAGISRKVTPHVLRHSLATNMLKRGADIRVIQRLLGHSSISTTEIYTHVDPTLLREVFRRTRPKY